MVAEGGGYGGRSWASRISTVVFLQVVYGCRINGFSAIIYGEVRPATGSANGKVSRFPLSFSSLSPFFRPPTRGLYSFLYGRLFTWHPLLVVFRPRLFPPPVFAPG